MGAYYKGPLDLGASHFFILFVFLFTKQAPVFSPKINPKAHYFPISSLPLA